MDLHSSNPLFKVNWITSLDSADYSQTQGWVIDAGQEYMLHDSIGKKLTNKQNYAVQSQHSAGPGVFLWKGSWGGGSCLFLDLGVGYVCSVCGNSEVCTVMTCAFSVCMSYFD